MSGSFEEWVARDVSGGWMVLLDVFRQVDSAVGPTLSRVDQRVGGGVAESSTGDHHRLCHVKSAPSVLDSPRTSTIVRIAGDMARPSKRRATPVPYPR